MIQRILHIVAPDTCIACDTVGARVCAHCVDAIATPKTSTCPLCNKLADGFRVCPSCRARSQLFAGYMAATYEGSIKQLLKEFKFQNRLDLADVLSAPMVAGLPFSDIDAVTFVPAVTSRYRRRGYNPAQLLAKNVGRKLDKPVFNLLGRLDRGRQVGLDRKHRVVAVAHKMYVTSMPLVLNKTILVVDDILTTGSTLSECARALKAAGAKRVYGAVVAKG